MEPREIARAARSRLMSASLVGARLPDLELPATDGTLINPTKLESCSIIFCYPYTGRPGISDPPGWDNIPGTHGSTSQAIAFSMLYPEFQRHGVKVFGLSLQTIDWQRECVTRCKLAFPLLSDEKREFTKALGLEVFQTGHRDFLHRRTLVCSNGIIIHDVSSIPQPAENAADVLKLVAP
jgi:peroxiredoxin